MRLERVVGIEADDALAPRSNDAGVADRPGHATVGLGDQLDRLAGVGCDDRLGHVA